MVPHPLIGAGYESFWSGERLIQIWTRMGEGSGGIVQAHNGYIDTYLNLGILGLALLLIGVLSGLLKVRKQFASEYAYAALRVSFIVTALGYNYTEAAFKPLNNVFVLLLFSILQVTRTSDATRAAPAARQPGGYIRA
jgi:exopolysaccharide production protein ExoQ